MKKLKSLPDFEFYVFQFLLYRNLKFVIAKETPTCRGQLKQSNTHRLEKRKRLLRPPASQ